MKVNGSQHKLSRESSRRKQKARSLSRSAAIDPSFSAWMQDPESFRRRVIVVGSHTEKP